MDSVIEVQRQTHEDIERFEKAITTLLAKPQQTHREKLRTGHKASQVLDRITARVVTLDSLYRDDERRQAEIQSISAPAQQNDLSEFYARLAKIEEHHRKYPDSGAGGFELELAGLLADPEEGEDGDYEQEDPISLMFSGEEGVGRYLDLYANHNAYNNLKDIGKRLSYIHYLDKLLATDTGLVHADVSKEVRLTKDYGTYIMALHAYLLSFTKRTEPLVDISTIQRDSEVELDKLWEEGKVEGWEQTSPNDAAVSGDEIWCSACQKKYSKKTVYDAHLTSKKHVKAAAREAESGATGEVNGTAKSSSAAPSTSTKASRSRNSALYTFLVTNLLLHHSVTLVETKSNVERRFALTAREREQELVEKPPPQPAPTASGEAGEEEEEERIYNPLKLPLGWDGKPIPYWLYKLHGLGVEYRCEICSDHVYMGRKNFDRHFQESRHAFGMRALGLPNTKHFHEITRIEDALSLAEKLKQEGRQEIFENETMEELEDDEGNVYSRKTYDDLKKQGII